MMAKLFVTIVIMLSLIAEFTEGANYVVGDSWGWQNPPNSSFYSDWASSHTFLVGDTLVFNFATGSHNVATVTEDAYNNCNAANALSMANTGPATITLNSTGTFYYFCAFANHCAANQKLAVIVVSSSATPPPGSTAGLPPSNSPPPPPDSSATSVVVSSTFLFILMGFMFM